MFIVDRIKADLNFLKDVANHHEDGNTIGLIERIFRDINTFDSKYLQHKDILLLSTEDIPVAKEEAAEKPVVNKIVDELTKPKTKAST